MMLQVCLLGQPLAFSKGEAFEGGCSYLDDLVRSSLHFRVSIFNVSSHGGSKRVLPHRWAERN